MDSKTICYPAKARAISQAAYDLLALLDSPESAAQAFSEMADAFNASAAELESAWQARGAGKVWSKTAKRLDEIVAVLTV